MAIEAWSEPIYRRQEGEVDREWRYKEPFLEWDGDLLSYSKLLSYAFEKEHAAHMPSPNKIFDEFLEDHPIKFHKDDKRNGRAPTHDQLQHWSKGSNVKCEIKYTWIEIRTVKREDDNKIVRESVANTLTEHAIKLVNIKINSIYRRELLTEKLNKSNKLTLSQDKAGSDADLADLQFIKELSKDEVDKHEFNFQGEVKTENKTSIERAFDDLYENYDSLISDTQKICQIQTPETK